MEHTLHNRANWLMCLIMCKRSEGAKGVHVQLQSGKTEALGEAFYPESPHFLRPSHPCDRLQLQPEKGCPGNVGVCMGIGLHPAGPNGGPCAHLYDPDRTNLQSEMMNFSWICPANFLPDLAQYTSPCTLRMQMFCGERAGRFLLTTRAQVHLGATGEPAPPESDRVPSGMVLGAGLRGLIQKLPQGEDSHL